MNDILKKKRFFCSHIKRKFPFLNDYDIEDIFSDILFYLCKNKKKYNTSFVLRSMEYRVIDNFRRDRTRKEAEKMFYSLNAKIFTDTNNTILVNELLSIPKQEEKEILLMWMNGHTFNEIGEFFDLSGCQVSRIFKTCTKKIREYINNNG